MVANKRILCVDDEKSIRDIIVQYVSSWGYEITCTGTPEETIEIFGDFNPYLVITDLSLNHDHIDGVRLADKLKREDPLCSFVAVSGYVEAFTLGYLVTIFTDVIEKPDLAPLEGILKENWEKRLRWEKLMKDEP